MSNTLLTELKNRELIHSLSDEAGIKTLLEKPITFYCGFDPTAASLHIGSLLPLLTLKRLSEAGHKPIALIGTATGMIGDPSGKSEERNLIDSAAVKKNAAGLQKQIKAILGKEAKIVENYDWLGKLNLIEFLRDVGKHFSVNQMCSKDSVKTRLENREQGISYTEFSYMLFQAYDFLELYKAHNCQLQIGGSDQWGNITEGTELVRRMADGKAYGLTFPLLTTASGTKFGKTEKGAVWLDPELTSPYEFYQYWINAADADVIKLLKFFTFLSLDEISEIEHEHGKAPEKRLAQQKLASEVTALIHGKGEVKRAEDATKVFFGGSLDDIPAETLLRVFSDVPATEVPSKEIDSGIEITELLVRATLAKSKGEAKRLVNGGGIYLNNVRIEEASKSVKTGDFIEKSVAVLRSGKKKYHLVKIS